MYEPAPTLVFWTCFVARWQTARTVSLKRYVNDACQLLEGAPLPTTHQQDARLHAYGKGCFQVALPAICFTRGHRGKLQNAPHVSLLLHDCFSDLLLSGLQCQTCCVHDQLVSSTVITLSGQL